MTTAATASKSPGISVGRIVTFKFDAIAAEVVSRRRTDAESVAKRVLTGHWHEGSQAHIGNEVKPGDELPIIITKVGQDSGGDTIVNGKVFLDGEDDYWAIGIHEGNDEGQWHWPTRV